MKSNIPQESESLQVAEPFGYVYRNRPYKFLIAASVALSLTFGSIQSKHQSVPVLSPKEQQHIIKETQCISEVLWFESRSEGKDGIRAVLSVIHNRKISKKYPDSYCSVVQQRFQFSYRNHLKKGQFMLIKTPLNALERKVATDVSTLAFNAATGRLKPSLPPFVIYYHSASMKVYPKWAIRNKFCVDCKLNQKNPSTTPTGLGSPRLYAKIGSHLFYRS